MSEQPTLSIVFKVVREMPDGRLVSPNIEGLWQVAYQPETRVSPPDPHALLFAYRSKQQAHACYRDKIQTHTVDQKFQLWRAITTLVEEGPQWVPAFTEQQFFLAYWQGQYYRKTMAYRATLMPAYLAMMVERDTVLCPDIWLQERLA